VVMKREAVSSLFTVKGAGAWQATCLESLQLWTNAVTVQIIKYKQKRDQRSQSPPDI
jgi:hypothetical protein